MFCARGRREDVTPSDSSTSVEYNDMYDPIFHVNVNKLVDKKPETRVAANQKKQKGDGRIKVTNKTTKYKLVTLADLEAGETFRFLAGVNSSNVYMVIDPRDMDDYTNGSTVYYVLLSNGRIYDSSAKKEVVRVSCELSYQDQA